MRSFAFTGFIVAAASSSALASSAAIDLNQDVAHIEFAGQPNPKALEFNAGLFHHEDDADIYFAGVATKDRMTNFRDVEFGLGGQIGHLDADEIDGTFAAIAVSGRYLLPDAEGVSLNIGVRYAPDVLTTDDVKSLVNFSSDIAYRVIPKGEIYAGYRHIEIDLKQVDNVTFDESWFAGFRLMF